MERVETSDFSVSTTTSVVATNTSTRSTTETWTSWSSTWAWTIVSIFSFNAGITGLKKLAFSGLRWKTYSAGSAGETRLAGSSRRSLWARRSR